MKKQLSGRTLLGVAVYRWCLLIVLLLLVTGISMYLHGRLDIEWTMTSLRTFVQSLGVWGPLSYIGILVFRFLFLIPSGLLLLASGLLFGPIYGTLYAGLGLLGSALWKYAMVSVVGPEVLVRQLPEELRSKFSKTAKRQSSIWALAGICAYPYIPKHVFQFAAILSGMALSAYVTAVSMGSFARAGIFAFAGETLYSGASLTCISLFLLTFLVFPLSISSWRQWMFESLQQTLSLKKPRSNT